MPPEEAIQIKVDQPSPRLDRFLAQTLPELSRSQIQKLIRQGHIKILNAASPGPAVSRARDSLAPGDTILVQLPTAAVDPIQPENIPLDVVYEDEALVVINKPAGLVVHPAHGHSGGTMVNALLARYPDLMAWAEADDTARERPGLVHRLDRDTSGLIVIARTPTALSHLQKQFKSRRVQKTYLALVYGQPAAAEGVIDVPLGRDPRHRQKIAARPDGKPARSHYRLLEAFEKYSLLEIGLETGRTHQIRVHLAWLKCPVVGDPVYGRRKNVLGLNRQFLHAWKLSFEHPTDHTPVALVAPLDKTLNNVLNQLR